MYAEYILGRYENSLQEIIKAILDANIGYISMQKDTFSILIWAILKCKRKRTDKLLKVKVVPM